VGAAAPPFAGQAPDAARAIADLQVLAGTIGIRSAGSLQESDAAEFIAATLREAGYDAEIIPFTFTLTEDTSVVTTEGNPDIQSLAMEGSPNGETAASGVYVGLGRPDDYRGLDVTGRIVVLDRGETTFGGKAQIAEAAGAAAVIVMNDQPGLFRGALDTPAGIPIVSVAGEQRQSLLDRIVAELSITVRAAFTEGSASSQNVVGRPSDAPCTGYLGAHYDSVPAGVGANDNGSGAVAMLELARVLHRDGLCMIAFGAEETGLFGSRDFVATAELSAIAWLINIDMVGKITSPRFIGDPELAAQAAAIATSLGYEIPVGAFPPRASSDHASFLDAGVPAITAHSGDDDFIHTPQDGLANVSADDVGVFLDVIAALVNQLTAPS